MRTTSGAATAPLVALVAALTLGLAGCSGGGSDHHSAKPSSTSQGGEAEQVKTVTTVAKVSGLLGKAKKVKMRDEVSTVVDGFFDHAYLGSFPRSSYSAAFASFTPGARKDAMSQLDLVTSSSLAGRVDQATATRRRVRLDVFAPGGHARGVTAHFVLDFTTTGQVKGSHQVVGDLYLSRSKGDWHVFGYDIDQPVDQAAAH